VSVHPAKKACLLALGAVVAVLVVTAVAWAVDSASYHGRVARNTTLAGMPVGGLHRPQLDAVVAVVAKRYASSPVAVKADGGGFSTDTAELKISVDAPRTTTVALRVGRTSSPVNRAWWWARSFVRDRRAPVQISVDDRAVQAVVAARDPHRVPPTEPAVTAKPDGKVFSVTAGKPGKGINPADVVEALPTAAASGDPRTPITVRVERGEVPPRFSHRDAEDLATRAEAAAGTPLTVRAGTATTTVPPTTLRPWVHSEVVADGLHLVVDSKRAVADLAKLFPAAATAPVDTTFVVDGGQARARPGTPGTTCCDVAAGTVVQGALLDGETRTVGTPAAPVALPLRPLLPRIPAADVPGLGIKEQVSTFTTRYPAGQPRVTNIHRFADIVKGHVILPGELFSLNGQVGERTLDKGFVVDHQINDEGKFDEAVGGGVSQFATTIFNAAFFAGLDYGEYQSHSIYISRYPYGREATVSWMHPDLQIKNTTPHAVMVWAAYDGTSLTVSMWSTKYLADVQQTAQTATPFGPGCTRVRTERTRKYLDGRTAVDTVSATYQPAEGVKCR